MTFQLGAGLLDACVLAVLRQEDTYGYRLTQALKEVVVISDSTLYPVLRRLRKEGYVDTYDQAFEGRNRRYYTITDKGQEQYHIYMEEWSSFKKRIDKILIGGVGIE